MLLNKRLLDKKRIFNLKEFDEKLRKKNAYKNFFIFIMGIVISSISVSLLYEPYDIVASGSTGLVFLITKFIDVDLSLMIFCVNAILLIIGFAVFGIEYGSKNILITILSPIFVKAATLLLAFFDFKGTSLFLIAVLAGIFSGVGTAFIRKSGYSSGGLCVFYDIINRKFKLSVGTASLICNAIIMFFSLIKYDISSLVYGFIALYVSSVVTDRVMIGISRNKAFYIVTKDPLTVKDYIVNNLNHCVTIINARGGYSNKKRKLLICVIPTIEYTKVKEIIREIDKDAFFLITDNYFVSK